MTVGISELPPEGMQLGGVALAGDTDRGTKTTEGLSLLFTTAGITVQGPQPQIERLLVWSGLDTATCKEKIVLPGGRSAAVMELTSGGQSIRFLLPTENVTPGQAAYLDQALPAWLTRYKGVGASNPPVPPAPPVSPAPAVQPPPPVQPAPPATLAGAAGPGAGQTSAERLEVGTATGETPPPPPASPTPAPPPPPPFSGAGVAAQASDPSARPAPAEQIAERTTQQPAGPDPVRPTSEVHRAAPPIAPPPPPPPPPPPAAHTDQSSAPEAAAPPPPPPAPSHLPPPPPPPTTPSGTSGWEVAIDPLPDGTAWDDPPLGQPLDGGGSTPPKKGRGWRKTRQTGATPVPPPGALPPPPSDPPRDPVPLSLDPPPPPPPPLSDLRAAPRAPGAVVWSPPIDPITGEAQWDGAFGPANPPPPVESPPTKAKGWRNRVKDRTNAEDTAVAAVGVAGLAASGAGTAIEETTPETPAAPSGAGPDRSVDSLTDSVSPPPPVAPWEEPHPSEPEDKPASRNNRTVLALLLVLLAVIGAIGYLVFKPKSNNTTAPPVTTATPGTRPPPPAADTALAASVNLRLGDLPGGWVTGVISGQVTRPPVAPIAAQVRANRAMASCVGVDYSIIAGLLGGSVLPGQTDSVRSPRFHSGSDPTVQMYSTTSVMSTVAQAQALGVPFTNPTFTTCFGQYQTALVSAAVPGATAVVGAVQLVAPTGVNSFGYLTTLLIPHQPNQVIGEVFMVGGRIETRLEPTTGGVAVPSDAFNSAYNAVVGRVAAARNN